MGGHKFFMENKTEIITVVIMFLALLVFFSILGITFKEKSTGENIYLRKELLIETFGHDKAVKTSAVKSSSYRCKYSDDVPGCMDKHCARHNHSKKECMSASHGLKDTPCGWAKWKFRHADKQDDPYVERCIPADISTKKSRHPETKKLEPLYYTCNSSHHKDCSKHESYYLSFDTNE